MGNCLLEGAWEGFEDAGAPPSGDGYFYVVQGQNFDCGFGLLGFDSNENLRSNTDPAACSGHPFTNVFADSETTVFGTVTGTLADTLTSNNVHETVEEESVGGASQMEHRYTFVGVPAGALVEVHVEAFWTPSPEVEPPFLEYSTDGVNFTPLTAQFFTSEDPDRDFETPLPGGISGTVTLRWVDPDPVRSFVGSDRLSPYRWSGPPLSR